MQTLVIFHQSAELYGSDLTILQLIRFLSENKPELKIYLLVPESGPLVKLVSPYCTVVLTNIVKVERSNFNFLFLLKLPFILINRYFFLMSLVKGAKGKYVIYNNTMAVLGSFIFGVFNKNVIGHVHEIIERPKFLSKTLCKVYSIFNYNLIFNSYSTQNWFKNNVKRNKGKDVVVYNGVAINSLPVKKRNKIRIALVGRINDWKGHKLLLSAFNTLSSDHSNLILDFYGDVYSGKEAYKTSLQQYVNLNDLNSKVNFHGFVEDQSFWSDIDILVVPSTEPEPFGMVAIQGMAHKIPVVVDDHGGLSEIVTPTSGFLFPPNDERELTLTLKRLIESPQMRLHYGCAGYERVKQNFSEEVYGQGILNLIEELLK